MIVRLDPVGERVTEAESGTAMGRSTTGWIELEVDLDFMRKICSIFVVAESSQSRLQVAASSFPHDETSVLKASPVVSI